jgi:hypothetical protein
VEIIDNFLLEEDYLQIKKIVFGTEFLWNYTEAVSAPPEAWLGVTDPNCKETDGFYHNVINTKIGYSNPSASIFEKFFVGLDNLGYKPDDLIILRLSMKFPKQGFSKESYQLPHVDLYDQRHDTLIYYFNDSDGETRIFDQKFNGEESKEFTVNARVKPVANRLLIFDGLQYHTASNPIETNRRVVLNVNLKRK